MRNVERIVVLYPGETDSARINRPQNYSLSRLLLLLHQTDQVPIYFLNQSKRHEQYGNIEFIHFTKLAFLGVLARCFGKRNTLIISQLHVYRKYAVLLRRILPGSRLLVRVGGVYYGQQFLSSPVFDRLIESELHYLRHTDMVLSTADGTSVDLYMERVGLPRARYRKWMNGFPVIENDQNYQRRNQIVCISRLSSEKAVDYVLESYALAMPALREPHKLIVVGDGPERARLTDLAHQLGVGSHVEFVGRSYDLAKYLYSSKLLVSGLANNTVMEAIATGTPVITVELGEMRTLYGHLPNVHVVDYPPGGYGPIEPAHKTVLARKTADRIAAVLNDYPSLDDARSDGDGASLSWDERLQKELDLYDSLFDGTPAEEEQTARDSVTARPTGS